jgi:hypothetical protein
MHAIRQEMRLLLDEADERRRAPDANKMALLRQQLK